MLDGDVLLLWLVLSLCNRSILLLSELARLLRFETEEVNLILGSLVERVELEDVGLRAVDAEVLGMGLPYPIDAAGHS